MFFKKRWVFNFLFKVSIEIDSLIYPGRTFQNITCGKQKDLFTESYLGLNIRITRENIV